LCRRPVALAAAINSGLNVDRSGWVAVRRRAGAAGVPRVDEPSEGAAAAAAARTRSEFDLEEWQQLAGSDAAESECEKANIQRPTQNGLGAVEFGADLRGGASL
jgi:hypothetical protein